MKLSIGTVERMEWILLVIGLVVGGGTGIGITWKVLNKDTDPVPVVVTGSKVGEKLADIDLVKIPCSKDYIEQNSDLLCRELFCRMQQRGIDSKTSAVDCSGISNMNNSLKFITIVTEHCKITQESTDEYNKCFDRFNRILTTAKSGQ